MDFIRPAFSAISSDNHAGYLWIITILGDVYTVLAALVRIFVKWGLTGIDDYLLGLATIFHLAQSVAIFAGLSYGLGKTEALVSRSKFHAIEVTSLASESLAILGLCIAKGSITAIQIRVFTLRAQLGWYICWSLVALEGLWGVGSILSLSVNCDLYELALCPGQHERWYFITAVDICLEVMIFCIPIVKLWKLSMKLQQKIEVVVTFSFRLPMIALSVYHLHTIFLYESSDQRRLAIVDSLLAIQIMLIWSIFSATIPNMRGFIKAFAFNFGMGEVQQSNVDSNEYELQTIGGSTRFGGRNAGSMAARPTHKRGSHMRLQDHFEDSDDDSFPPFRPDNVTHTTIITHSDLERQSTKEEIRYPSRRGSQELIIKKDTHWSVTTSG